MFMAQEVRSFEAGINVLAKPAIHPSFPGSPMSQAMKSTDQNTDLLRLNDLVKKHGLHYRRVRNTYSFDDFTAHGLNQALGFAEGFDRAALKFDKSVLQEGHVTLGA